MGRHRIAAERFFPGTCAWSFDDWRDSFYPHGLPRNRWLEFYARNFPAVEMDSSFYHVPSGKTVGHWAEMTPPRFRFCPKLPKTLSHDRRLEEPSAEIGMMRRLAADLGPRCGCALLQLPASFHARASEERRLRAFLRLWPEEIPLAVEFRHESWHTPHAARILEDHQAAWAWTDTHPLEGQKHAGFGFLPVTAPHLYLRLLGDLRTKYGPEGRELHRYGRTLWPRETALEHWAVKLSHHATAEAAYAFANNHYEGMAVETVRRLAAKLECRLSAEPPAAAGGQLDLFGPADPR